MTASFLLFAGKTLNGSLASSYDMRREKAKRLVEHLLNEGANEFTTTLYRSAVDQNPDNDFEVECAVTYDFDPGEEQSHWHPGAPAEATITSVLTKEESPIGPAGTEIDLTEFSKEELDKLEDQAMDHANGDWGPEPDPRNDERDDWDGPSSLPDHPAYR